MDGKTSEWRPGPTVCRCCLTEGCYKDISTEYFWMGKREVYAEMLSETLNVSIAYSQSGGPNSNSRLICEPCISRLRDAAEFKRQVQECEKTFMQHLDPGTAATSTITLEVEAVPEQKDKSVKLEQVKTEKQYSDDDFGGNDFAAADDDDDDDLDDQPLTKFASKVPKKESVDLLDLFDNSQITLKRKSKTKTPTTKKTKVAKKDPVKATAASSKAVAKPVAKKKKEINQAKETSLWQMTLGERRNASIFIQKTTVRPFMFMGSSFKCFFCLKYYSEVNELLEHTSTHVVTDRQLILAKYVHKSKRNLQVDISGLKCRLCNKDYSGLDSVRNHLDREHGVIFSEASNGMTEFNMRVVDAMFSCHICSETFHSFAMLNSHMNLHVAKVVCETCGAAFQSQIRLLTHKETHQRKNYTCKYCDKVFFKSSQVKYHTDKIHKGRSRVKMKNCPHCTETFREHYTKMAHLKKIHGISKTFQCHICKKSFNTRRAITEHTTRSHTDKYKCEICEKRFSMDSRLKLHMVSHTGERNFVCNVCKNAFMHKPTLRRHMRIHEKDAKIPSQ